MANKCETCEKAGRCSAINEFTEIESGSRYIIIVTISGGQYSPDEDFTAKLIVDDCDGYEEED